MRPAIPHRLEGMRALAERFDIFVLDQFGVLHDGSAPYPGAVAALDSLRAAGKRTLLLSNSGKRSNSNEARLVGLGFAPGSWDHFLSSGELAWRLLRAEMGDNARKRCLLIARDGDRSAIEGLPLDTTEDAAAADLVLLSASQGDVHDLDHYRQILRPAARRGIPCLCTNPDRVMLTPEGARFGAGRIAEVYTELGGEVRWIGKPHPAIYGAALETLGDPDPRRVVCVGDSIEHDIAGGRGAGLATALVLGGILASRTQAELAQISAEHEATPDFVLPAFTW